MSAGDAKVALVTGSSSGIGEATVKLFARQGYRVAVHGSNKDKVTRVVDECAKLVGSENAFGLVEDFTEALSGEIVVNKTLERFGRLDVLVNNAGIFMPTPSTGSQLQTYGTYKNLLNINVDATVRATLTSVSHLRQTKGNLVFVSSVASTKALACSFGYCMSKSAMSMLARCFALDLAPDVRVNTVSPGPVRTEILDRAGIARTDLNAMGSTTLMGRIGEVDEVASLIYYLVSDEAKFITGQEIFIDGGYALQMFHSVHEGMK